MGERHRAGQREREAGLRVWQLLGGFWWFVCECSDPDVLLGNSSRRLNSRRKKKQKEKEREGEKGVLML